MLIDFTEQFQNGYSGYERFLEILSVEPEIADKPDAKELTDVKGAITFENVSFRYKDGVDEVLSGVNLSVRPGENMLHLQVLRELERQHSARLFQDFMR